MDLFIIFSDNVLLILKQKYGLEFQPPLTCVCACVCVHKVVCIRLIITFVILSNDITYLEEKKKKNCCLQGIINFSVQHIFVVSSPVFPPVIMLNNI